MRCAGFIAVAVLLFAGAVLAAEIPRDLRRSGYSFMSPDTRAMQDDDTANPGMLWVLDGETLWKRKTGAADNACADCHNDARASMKGVAARYPAYDKALGRLSISSSASIFAAPITSRPRRSLTKATTARAHRVHRAAVARMPIEPGADPALAPFVARARSLHAAPGPAQSFLQQSP
jgi:sulfur-oxidizing protein SoxA